MDGQLTLLGELAPAREGVKSQGVRGSAAGCKRDWYHLHIGTCRRVVGADTLLKSSGSGSAKGETWLMALLRTESTQGHRKQQMLDNGRQ